MTSELPARPSLKMLEKSRPRLQIFTNYGNFTSDRFASPRPHTNRNRKCYAYVFSFGTHRIGWFAFIPALRA